MPHHRHHQHTNSSLFPQCFSLRLLEHRAKNEKREEKTVTISSGRPSKEIPLIKSTPNRLHSALDIVLVRTVRAHRFTCAQSSDIDEKRM